MVQRQALWYICKRLILNFLLGFFLDFLGFAGLLAMAPFTANHAGVAELTGCTIGTESMIVLLARDIKLALSRFLSPFLPLFWNILPGQSSVHKS